MFGFKSFADKQEIKFGEGITCIVGPNGCGKSNVADAIRWVLGEQSAKTLRGSSMQDVIFNGTQGRKSLSYAEVSLFFDNTNRIFNIDYNEVIITRKLFRSGESEYYINKQPARLRDIVDLLHECGIGKEGYTIIGQGKVQEIMTAKPEDRRAIFEEATGISKFKAKKNESERKLDRTRENLIRFNDIMSELENQLEPLSRQAEKTRQYRELSEELKHHEINSFISRSDSVASEKNKINVKIQGIDDETAETQRRHDQARADYDRILSEINGADEKLSKLHQERLDREISIEKQLGEEKLFKERISFLNQQLDKNKTEIATDKEQIQINGETIKVNIQTIIATEKELDELNEKNVKLSKDLLSVSETIAEKEGKAQEHQKRIIESIESLSDININKGSLGAQKTALLSKKQELTEEAQEITEKRNRQFTEKEEINAKLDTIDKDVYELKGKISAKEDEIREINENGAKVENEIYNLNSNLTMLTAKENFIVGLKESYEGYQPAVKRLLITAKEDKAFASKIKGVVASIIKTDARYDVAIETCLGSAAQNIVTDNTEDAKYLIEYLKSTKGGRVTFLPVSSVKPRRENDQILLALKERGVIGLANKLVTYDAYYENVISSLLGNTLIVDDIANATDIAKKYRFAFKIVTLEGDVFATQGSMTGGSRRQDTPNLLAGDRQLDEIKSKIAQRRKEMEDLKKAKADLDGKRNKTANELSLLNEMYQAKKQEVIVLNEKLTAIENLLIENGRDLEELNDAIDMVDEKLAEIDKDFEVVKSGTAKLEEEKGKASSEADKQRKEFDALTTKRDELREESTAVQLEISSKKATLENLRTENSRLEKEIEELQESVLRRERNIVSTSEIIDEIKRSAEKTMLSKEEQDKVNELRANIEKLDKEKVTLRGALAKADEDRQYLANKLTELAEKRHAQEIALTKIDSDLEYSGQRIWEEYQETYDTAQKYKVEGYNYKEGEQEITRIKRKINSLGSINANAIDDYAELKKRYDEMLVEKTDLEKAESDIREVIETLKGEMLTQFNEGFNKINENFGKIFKELFGGGRAMLELDYTDCDDQLEAGVNIIVEPPGKKLQKLSLYSGGEQALTAIAILFSILKLRPMPFCVLDEIEAALDEANVDRFARYLKKFSQDTQFIVITHRKPTMELADALFGVTMQEKGVSKLVSVKLADIVDTNTEQ